MDSHLNRDYSYLIDIFGEDKLKERYATIYQDIEFFLNALELKDYFKPSKSTIHELVLDYFADIARLKEFHEIKKVHAFKVASYTAFWVLRRNPIQMYKEPDDRILDETEYVTAINQYFVAITILAWAFDYRDIDGENEELGRFIEQFYYLAIYRYYTPQFFELLLHALSISPKFKIITEK